MLITTATNNACMIINTRLVVHFLTINNRYDMRNLNQVAMPQIAS